MSVIKILSFVVAFCAIEARMSMAENKIETIEKWKYISAKNKMDETLRYVTYASGLGGSIVFKCDATGKNSVYVSFVADDYLGVGKYKNRTIKYRLDKNSPEEDRWIYEDKSAYQLDKTVARAMLEKIKRSKTLLIHAFRFDYSTVEAEIDLSGADKALTRLVADCKS